MPLWLDAILSFPTIVYTILLVVVVTYWLLAIVGLVDFSHGHHGHMEWHDLAHGHGHDTHFPADAHGHGETDVSTIASFAMAMGLSGVPFSIVVSLIVFFAWVISALVGEYVLVWVPTQLLRILFGLAVMAGAFAMALPLTALTIRPMRPLFVVHNAPHNAGLVGLPCRILTLTVDEKFGQAEVTHQGSTFNIKIWAPTPNGLTKGSISALLDYDQKTGRYEVATVDITTDQ
ncbi:ubiquinone biosynthesis protein [Chitinivorax sp. B]|uniref:ubiquinone biosynthesis protein n=1 Tax=Chitinivorax sp. B TaxID=2502235 RepID=UPI0010F903DD|nr:ubiquinone biosynthesis protein [Chitinivorax sp. B]